jgi:hypothetical protein
MGATLNRRESSERGGLAFAGNEVFLKFISTDLLYSGFDPFSLFSKVDCYIVAIEFENIATGDGRDHSM